MTFSKAVQRPPISDEHNQLERGASSATWKTELEQGMEIQGQMFRRQEGLVCEQPGKQKAEPTIPLR